MSEFEEHINGTLLVTETTPNFEKTKLCCGIVRH